MNDSVVHVACILASTSIKFDLSVTACHFFTQVVQELYLRYLKQQERYRGYRNLFVFLGFMALFMAILFTQRQANASHQVSHA